MAEVAGRIDCKKYNRKKSIINLWKVPSWRTLLEVFSRESSCAQFLCMRKNIIFFCFIRMIDVEIDKSKKNKRITGRALSNVCDTAISRRVLSGGSCIIL